MPVDDRAPAVKGPPLTCDTHLHVFGDPATYPYAADKRNSPPAAPLADYMADYMADYRDVARRCGIERMVFTQPSTYGRDNTCLLDAIKLCDGKARGIVDIDENAPDAELARLNAAGVVGKRCWWKIRRGCLGLNKCNRFTTEHAEYTEKAFQKISACAVFSMVNMF